MSCNWQCLCNTEDGDLCHGLGEFGRNVAHFKGKVAANGDIDWANTLFAHKLGECSHFWPPPISLNGQVCGWRCWGLQISKFLLFVVPSIRWGGAILNKVGYLFSFILYSSSFILCLGQWKRKKMARFFIERAKQCGRKNNGQSYIVTVLHCTECLWSYSLGS